MACRRSSDIFVINPVLKVVTMRASTVITIACVAIGLWIALVMARPYFDHLATVEAVCGKVPVKQRTKAQRKLCAPGEPVGHIIPGIL